MSHLLQMRGLKQLAFGAGISNTMSHLLQMRGLKLLIICREKLNKCRIFYRCVD